MPLAVLLICVGALLNAGLAALNYWFARRNRVRLEQLLALIPCGQMVAALATGQVPGVPAGIAKLCAAIVPDFIEAPALTVAAEDAAAQGDTIH